MLYFKELTYCIQSSEKSQCYHFFNCALKSLYRTKVRNGKVGPTPDLVAYSAKTSYVTTIAVSF